MTTGPATRRTATAFTAALPLAATLAILSATLTPTPTPGAPPPATCLEASVAARARPPRSSSSPRPTSSNSTRPGIRRASRAC